MERSKYIRQDIMEYFDLSGTSPIQIEMTEGGKVKINSLVLEANGGTWEGIYFHDVPIAIDAIPEPGFVFVGWEGGNQSQDKNLTMSLSQPVYLKAIFKSDNSNKNNWLGDDPH